MSSLLDGPSAAVLVSGKGGNLRALLDAQIPICVVIADRPAPAIEPAIRANIPVEIMFLDAHQSKQVFEDHLSEQIDRHGADLVVLAGFLRVLSGPFVERYQGRMVNIHPSLLPAFPGLDTHRRALEAGVREHGCTAHWVAEELDAGPVIRQCSVRVHDDDDASSLRERVARAEHAMYPQVVRELLDAMRK